MNDDDVIKTDDGLIFNPFNSLNTEITLNDIQCILTKYGIPPKIFNSELYRRAFVHRSYTKRPEFENLQQNIQIVDKPSNCLPLSTKSNERLEFLGDSVLGLVVTEELYRRYPDLDESRLSPLRSGIVNMRALADIARTLELGQYMRLGKGEETTGGRDKNSLLADALEALIGAIYLEVGFTGCAEAVVRLIETTIESAMAQGSGLDGKTALQELLASIGRGVPEYLVSESGPDHDKDFTAIAMVGDVAIADGSGKSKREAEQAAARTAYAILQREVTDAGTS
jgi:ribonuclease-3